jgi:hypothetical protein
MLPTAAESRFLSTGLAKEIARAGLGRYYQLPIVVDAGEAIAALSTSAMADAKL